MTKLNNNSNIINSKDTGQAREHFSNRLGFILISAGCAIGLGNVWKFPYEVGQNGGGAFLLLYLVCIVVMGFPLLALEFSVGRASQKSNAYAYNVLEPPNTKWHLFKWVSISGQYILMMFYTCVCGWMLDYIFKEASGILSNPDSVFIESVYQQMIQNPYELVFWMILACVIGMAICVGGVQKGIEKVTKYMMIALLFIMIILAVFAVCQPGADAGLSFYFFPDFSKITQSPQVFCEVLYSAMSLAFFTLSVGIGSMVIFGSYINKEKALFGEAVTIGVLDVGVAIVCGMIIFPACFAYGVSPSSGPSLVFQALPSVFANMPFGNIVGTLFFIFLSFAAMSTIIAIFENIIAFWMDLFSISRKKSVTINLVLIILLSIPCCLGFNLLSGIEIPLNGVNTVMDIEDFVISNNLLPLGAIFFCLFCTSKHAWGWKNAITEINTGQGLKFPKIMYGIVKCFIPICILFIFIVGWMFALKI